MKRATVLIAIVAALVWAADSNAAMTEADVAAVAPTAQSAWPDSACRGLEHVYLNADASLIDLGDVAGGAGKATCEVWVSSAVKTREELCAVLTHEFGHLALSGTAEDHDVPGFLTTNFVACARFAAKPKVQCRKVRISRKRSSRARTVLVCREAVPALI